MGRTESLIVCNFSRERERKLFNKEKSGEVCQIVDRKTFSCSLSCSYGHALRSVDVRHLPCGIWDYKCHCNAKGYTENIVKHMEKN